MIYFLRSVETGYIKIGTTQNLHQRLRLLATKFGKLEVLGVLPGNRPFEKALHMAFKDHVVTEMGREWFFDTPSIRKYIDSYAWAWDKQKKIKQKRLYLDPPQYRNGVNCRLYDLIVKKRLEPGFENFGIRELSTATGVSVAQIKLLAKNVAHKFYNADMDALMDFFHCQVDDILTLDNPDWRK